MTVSSSLRATHLIILFCSLLAAFQFTSAPNAFAKTLIGGAPDIRIITAFTEPNSNEAFYLADSSDFEELMGDFDKLPLITSNYILPELSNHIMSHENTLSNDYVEDIQIHYNAIEGSVDMLVVAHPDSLGCNTESCSHKVVELSLPAELSMSHLNGLFIMISVYSNLTSGPNYAGMIKMIEEKAGEGIQVLALEAQETLAENKDKILSEKIIEGVNLEKSADLVRVSIRFPPFGSGDSYIPASRIDTVDIGKDVARVPEFGAMTSGIVAAFAVTIIIYYGFQFKRHFS